MEMIVSPYEAEMWPCVARLSAQWEFMPYAQSGYGMPAATALCLERMAHTLAGPHAQAMTALCHDALAGMGVLTPLPWDSAQIGLSAARLDYLIAQGNYATRRQVVDALLARLLTQAREQNIRHLSARIDAGDLAIIHALEHAGMELIDGLLTFALDISDLSLPKSPGAFHLRLATPDDAERTAELAKHAYRQDRFHADPAIEKERADNLHACWLRNSCTGQAADAVVIAEEGTELLGFVTCKLNRDTTAHFGAPTGTIALVATAESARGRGVGKQATLAALRWMRSQGVQFVEVGTQIRNIAAGRLYESCGFRLSGSSLTFRKLLS